MDGWMDLNFLVSPSKRGKLLIWEKLPQHQTLFESAQTDEGPCEAGGGRHRKWGKWCVCAEKEGHGALTMGAPVYMSSGRERGARGGIVNQHGTNKKLHSVVPPRTTPTFSIEMRPEKDKCRSLPRRYSKHKQLSLERPQKLQTLERLEVRERLQLKLNRPGGKDVYSRSLGHSVFFK